MKPISARVAAGLTRLLLRLYPPSFRRELGGGMVRDVRRRATEVGDRRAPLTAIPWLLRLGGSLLLNAVWVWKDTIHERSTTRTLGPSVSWLDFKLGLRMLVRFPGLTLVAGMAIAFAIGMGAGSYQFITDWFTPTMPFEHGERIVELWNDDRETGRQDPRVLHDYVVWRQEVTTVTEIGAYRTFQRNLITERGGSTRRHRCRDLDDRPRYRADAAPLRQAVAPVGRSAGRTGRRPAVP